jgi:hypothetical protein
MIQDENLLLALGGKKPVFQAIVYAIKACAAKNLYRKYKNRCIYIQSDSQVAIKALAKYQISSKLVWFCHQFLTKLAKYKGSADMGARS